MIVVRSGSTPETPKPRSSSTSNRIPTIPRPGSRSRSTEGERVLARARISDRRIWRVPLAQGVRHPPHRPADRRGIAGTIAASLRATGRICIYRLLSARLMPAAQVRRGLRSVSAGAVADRSSRRVERADGRRTDGAFRPRRTAPTPSGADRCMLRGASSYTFVMDVTCVEAISRGTPSTSWRIAGSRRPSTKSPRAIAAGCFCR